MSACIALTENDKMASYCQGFQACSELLLLRCFTSWDIMAPDVDDISPGAGNGKERVVDLLFISQGEMFVLTIHYLTLNFDS